MTTAVALRITTFLNQRVIVHCKQACPLCRESHAADVAAPLRRGEERLGECTWEMIKVLHPDWVEGDGSPSSCWSFHANLIRILNEPGGFDPRFQIERRKGDLTRELKAA